MDRDFWQWLGIMSLGIMVVGAWVALLVSDRKLKRRIDRLEKAMDGR